MSNAGRASRIDPAVLCLLSQAGAAALVASQFAQSWQRIDDSDAFTPGSLMLLEVVRVLRTDLERGIVELAGLFCVCVPLLVLARLHLFAQCVRPRMSVGPGVRPVLTAFPAYLAVQVLELVCLTPTVALSLWLGKLSLQELDRGITLGRVTVALCGQALVGGLALCSLGLCAALKLTVVRVDLTFPSLTKRLLWVVEFAVTHLASIVGFRLLRVVAGLLAATAVWATFRVFDLSPLVAGVLSQAAIFSAIVVEAAWYRWLGRACEGKELGPQMERGRAMEAVAERAGG